MEPSFTDHALRQATLRGLTREDIEYAWARPVSRTEAGSRPDTLKFAGRMPSGNRVQIVVAADDRSRIISVWPL